jgi:hypothetical protein
VQNELIRSINLDRDARAVRHRDDFEKEVDDDARARDRRRGRINGIEPPCRAFRAGGAIEERKSAVAVANGFQPVVQKW